ncbi:MoaD/ThiS family protein [Candidatus Hecatella orcuttiae]|jgi:molybdopterin converting factor small subunit|uniref:MoaD/ThiS family protein n=1 Tax=Candidatus Hecatella orcuttiae TaxID=1935119 RepID=UPI002867ED2D|nr:MoaD/ThiS family protein [Candidatus Hecatella orcuttiae]
MKVKVEFVGFLKNLAGLQQTELSLDRESCQKLSLLIDLLEKKFGKNLGVNLVERRPDGVRLLPLVLKNGVEVSALQGLNTPVEEGDSLVFVPVSHGG